jgi:AraC-like DNA-binding protein
MQSDCTFFVRPRYFQSIELASASYTSRQFPVHVHSEYVVGMIEDGAERLDVGDQSYCVPKGSVLMLNPNEPHANASIAGETLRYRVFYLAPSLMSRLAKKSGSAEPPDFKAVALSSSRLFRILHDAHEILGSETSETDQQAAFDSVIAALRPHLAPRVKPSDVSEDDRIARVKAFIDEHLAEELNLAMLSDVAGLSAFHLVRRFRRDIGLPPHAYQTQQRVHAARQLLLEGRAIADTALALGFSDQSHLSRHFQRIVGTSPARYRSKNVQY